MTIDGERVIRTRDAEPCACGHKRASHGSFATGHEFVGIGLGPCGIDRDTRNAATGYLGDKCPCAAFKDEATYPRTAADGSTIWACCVSSIGPICQHREARA